MSERLRDALSMILSIIAGLLIMFLFLFLTSKAVANSKDGQVSNDIQNVKYITDRETGVQYIIYQDKDMKYMSPRVDKNGKVMTGDAKMDGGANE